MYFPSSLSPLTAAQASPMGGINTQNIASGVLGLRNQAIESQILPKMLQQKLNQARAQSGIMGAQAAYAAPMAQQALNQSGSMSGILGAQARYANPMQQQLLNQAQSQSGIMNAQSNAAPNLYSGQGNQSLATAGILNSQQLYSMAMQQALVEQQQQAALQSATNTRYLPDVIKSQITGNVVPAEAMMLRDKTALATNPGLYSSTVASTESGQNPFNQLMQSTPPLSGYRKVLGGGASAGVPMGATMWKNGIKYTRTLAGWE